MFAAATSSTITRGTDYALGLKLQDSPNSEFLALAEWSFSAVLTSGAGVTLVSLSLQLVADDCVRFLLTDIQTAALAVQTGAHLAIRGTRPDGTILPLVSARVTVTNL
jgi:hypothetical protein